MELSKQSPATSRVVTAESLEDREMSIIRELKKELENLREIGKKIKTAGATESIDKLLALHNHLVANRNDRKAFKQAAAAKEATATNINLNIERMTKVITTKVESSRAMIVEAINGIAEKTRTTELKSISLEEGCKSEILEAITDLKAGIAARETETQWSEVVRKKRPRDPTKGETLVKLPDIKPRGHRSRPLAVIVSKENDSFPELLKTLRSKVDSEKTGTMISKLRETRNGNLLMEINGGAEAAEIVRREVARSLGPEASVRKTENVFKVELRDLDGMTTSEEIILAINREADTAAEEVKVLRTWNTYGGSKAAVILAPKDVAEKLLKAGRLRVGLVYCRIRESETKERCFKCLGYGHLSRECKGVDRSKCCRRCGVADHFAKDCSANQDQMLEFKKIMASEGSRREDPAPKTQDSKGDTGGPSTPPQL